MSDWLTKRRAMLSAFAVAAFLIAGCNAPSTATDDSTDSAKQSVPADESADTPKNPAGQKNVTFEVGGMNKKLDIY